MASCSMRRLCFSICLFTLSVLLYHGKSSTSQEFVVKCFQPPLQLSGKLCVSSSSFSYPITIQVPGRMCHQSIQTSYSWETLSDGSSLASHSSQHADRCSSLVSHHIGHHHGCFTQLGAMVCNCCI